MAVSTRVRGVRVLPAACTSARTGVWVVRGSCQQQGPRAGGRAACLKFSPLSCPAPSCPGGPQDEVGPLGSGLELISLGVCKASGPRSAQSSR